MTAVILAVFYAAMVVAGYVVELVFGAAGLTPTARNALVLESQISWNYTTWLNLTFLALAGLLVWRFFATGSGSMLAMMGGGPPAEEHSGHDHAMSHDAGMGHGH